MVFKRSVFQRRVNRDNVKVVTYKFYKSFVVTAASNLSSYQLNPVYEFVNNDPRYADFIKTCNEWRVMDVRFKVTPVNILSANLSTVVNMAVANCVDKAAPYRASAQVATPVNSIMSVPNAAVKIVTQGMNMSFYQTTYAATGQKQFVLAG